MVKPAKTQYVCQECGNTQPRWSGRCPNCGAWNSLMEEKTAPRGQAMAGSNLLTVEPLAKVKVSAVNQRLDTKLAEFNRVLGGGIVAGSLSLVAGEPGIGKSTLLLKLAEQVAKTHSVLYVSGEESSSQIKLRANRTGVRAAKLDLASATNSDETAATIAAGQYQLIIVDSIQTMATALATSAAGTISQITASAQLFLNAAKTSHTAVILTGHVTKEGNIAGPRLLEHIVDVVLYLEGERFGHFKLLRGIKNRFGSTDEVGIFMMTGRGMEEVANPSAAFLEQRQSGEGSVVLATIEGTRALLVEVQALVSVSSFGYPKRTTAGFDLNRLNLLLAVLNQRAGLKTHNYDVYVNIVGGLKLAEPAADLAVALAVVSAAQKQTLKPKTVVFGEVGLSGEIRAVSYADKRLNEAKKLGFNQAIGRGQSAVSGLAAVTNLKEAVAAALSPRR